MRLFLLLLLLWLVLNESASPGQVLLGSAIALAAAAAYARLQVGKRGARPGRPVIAARLALAVAADIVRSNIAVGRIVLGLRRGARTAGFLSIPLELRDTGGLAVLACIVTATPGTSWIRYDREQGVVMLHVLDLAAPDALVKEFKQRYETPLLEIFR